MKYDEDDYLMLSGLQHFIFCRRQWALIHLEQQWSENYQTTAGMLMHKNAHDENKLERRGDCIITRGLRISSASLGLTGQCDVVEFHKDPNGISIHGFDGTWLPVPVEYKRGKPKDGWEDISQLCAQAICLEEMFLTKIPTGYLYYGKTAHRTEIPFTDELRAFVRKKVEDMHALYKRGHTPMVKPTPKCEACSLYGLCMPKLYSKTDVHQYMDQFLKE